MSWIGCGRKWSWPEFRHYPGICLEELRKTTTNLSQDSWSPGRDLNVGLLNTEQEGYTFHSDVQWGCSLTEKTNSQAILANLYDQYIWK
jgi:hypothetical protein